MAPSPLRRPAQVVCHAKPVRDYDARRLDVVANDPEVRPYVLAEGDAPLLLAPLITDLRNVALMSDYGGLVFVFQGPGTYEVHTMFLPEARGAWAVAFTQESLRWMFTRTDMIELWTKVPAENKAALGLVRSMRGRLEFTRLRGFGGSAIAHYILRYNDWVHHDPVMLALGTWFREMLEAKLGRFEEVEPARDVMFGATIAMFRVGQLDKAILLHNRWTSFAGYPPIGLVTRWPVTLDLGDTIVAFSDDMSDFSVVSRKGRL